MKICIVANGYPSLKDPQFGCFEADQAMALKKAGHEVSIIYVDGRFRLNWRKFDFSTKKEKGIKIYGLFLFPLHILFKLNYKLHFKIRCRLLDWVFKYMLKHSTMPDIIYAHYLFNIGYATYLKEKYSIPLVGIEHWSVLNQNALPKNVYYRGKIAYSNADKLLAVSNSLTKSIKKYFGIDAIVVNNMVGQEFLVERSIYPKKDNSCFYFLAIGSLIPLKGFDLLIDAFYKTGLSEQNCKLTIIGGGNEQKKLQEQINSLSLQESVRLIGRKNKQEIISCLQDSHVFVLSSHAETFSVVCIEAMSQGIPVIATACGGPEEFVTKEVGILVKPSDVDAMANAMIQMYENYHLYDNEKIAEYCRSKFAPEVIAQQLSSIFEEVVSNNKEKQ